MSFDLGSISVQDSSTGVPNCVRASRCLGFGFWGIGILVNVCCVSFSLTPDIYLLGPLFVGALTALPVLCLLGVCWAARATSVGGMFEAKPHRAWIAASALTLLPVVTVLTVWPLRLGFLLSMPALERLADRVAGGHPTTFPRAAGLFTLGGAAVDPETGNVGLMIDPNPSGPTGFVRTGRGVSFERSFRPIGGDDLNIALGSRWWYREED